MPLLRRLVRATIKDIKKGPLGLRGGRKKPTPKTATTTAKPAPTRAARESTVDNASGRDTYER